MVYRGEGNTRFTEEHAKLLADFIEKNPDVPVKHLPRLVEAVPFGAPTMRKAMQAYQGKYPVLAKFLERLQARRFGPKQKLTPERTKEIGERFKADPTVENFQRICEENPLISKEKLLNCVVVNFETASDRMRFRTTLKYSKK